jgi:predicted nucleotidyltransferase component of viral defense system
MGGTFMAVTRKSVLETSEHTKFAPVTTEKVLRLIELLNEIKDHDALKNKLILKGGTAINLFVLDLPRLSVDIDLNYIGTLDVDQMKSERLIIEKSFRAICARLGMNMQIGPTEHAGGKWNVHYPSVLGGADSIQVDLNFMYRTPLWPAEYLDSHALGTALVKQFPVLNYCELYAGKLRALLSRRVSRDLYDTTRIKADVDTEKLRLALVIYGAMNPKDWRTVSPGSIACSAADVTEKLLPLLNASEQPAKADIEAFTDNLVAIGKAKLADLFPLTSNESEFVRLVREEGIIDGTLITADPELISKLAQHPSLLWRASKANA